MLNWKRFVEKGKEFRWEAFTNALDKRHLIERKIMGRKSKEKERNLWGTELKKKDLKIELRDV
jgi:hypothetical protein